MNLLARVIKRIDLILLAQRSRKIRSRQEMRGDGNEKQE